MATANRYAVLDVETTGFSNRDRIVEIAVVVLRHDGEIVDEFDTLINPMRDIGPTHIHGITPSMVSAAPTFDEAAASVAARIEGAILVAHNLSFDARMLQLEFDRAEAELDRGKGICTLRLTGEKLRIACERHRVRLDDHHRALADARATACLLRLYLEECGDGYPARVTNLRRPISPRTLRRESSGAAQQTGRLAKIVARMRYPTSDGDVLCYLDALDSALDDLTISQLEAHELRSLATDLGLSQEQVAKAHRSYLALLIAGATRDGIVTAAEYALMQSVARALGISDISIPEAAAKPSSSSDLTQGTRICFTGTAVGSDGKPIERSCLEEAAVAAGFQPVGSVSKKGCDLLVAADPCSGSGKAANARKHGIPVISVEEFFKVLGAAS